MKGQRGKSTLAAGPQQPRSTSGIKPALTFGPRRILNNSEQKIALKTIFCAKPPAAEDAGQGFPIEGIASSVVVDQCHPSIGMGIDVATGSGGSS